MAPSSEHHVVTAVLVTHEGASWLPETLKALLTQTRPVDRMVAADTGSGDAGPSMLADVMGDEKVLVLPSDTGFGAAVAAALRHPAASTVVPGEPGHPATEWIWLLHDDSAPAPDALEWLLATANAHPPATILGPKLRDWTDRRLLLEAGVAIGRLGRRETGLEPREFDQGQHDGVREVMAVSTAGMLVRRDVWDQLGGLDTDLGLFRDDVDFGWRAYAAGHRVLIATGAVCYHAEAAARGKRDVSLPVLDRYNALFVLFANLPVRALVLSVVVNSCGSLLRSLFFLASKRPALARDEIAALGALYRRPGRVRRARGVGGVGGGSVGGGGGRAVGDRVETYRNIGRFRPKGQARRRFFDAVGTLLSGVAPADAAGRHHAFGLEEEGLDEQDFSPGPGRIRRLLARPGILVVLGLTLITFAAERSLLWGGGTLGGGALVPVQGGASDLWNQYLSGWHPIDLGSARGAPPYVGVLALLSTVLLGKPWLVVTLLLLGSVPLAGLTAYVAARAIVPGRPAVAAWTAVTYALLPVLSDAISGGRLGTTVGVVLLPLIGLFAFRMFTDVQARHAVWAMAALLTVATAFAPLIWVLVACAGSLVAYFTDVGHVAGAGHVRHVRHVRRRIAVVIAVPPLLTLPWWLGLVADPSGFLREAGVPSGPVRVSSPSLFLLAPGGRVIWASAGLIATAVVALVLRRRRAGVLTGWLLALFGLLVAILVSASGARDWPGIALTFAAAGLVVAASGVLRRALDVLSSGSGGRGVRSLLGRTGAVIVVALAVSAPLGMAGRWVAIGAHGPLTRGGPGPVPVFLDASGATRPRMLVLAGEPGGVTGRHGGATGQPGGVAGQPGGVTGEPGGVTGGPGGVTGFTVLRTGGPSLGVEAEASPRSARARLGALVAAFVSGQGAGEVPALARFGIQYVVVPHPGADPAMVRTLDAVPDLLRLGRTARFAVWQLARPGGRLMLDTGGSLTPVAAGEITASLSVPPSTSSAPSALLAREPGRRLLLAEPADGGWHATLNGKPLRSRTVDGWAASYEIPPSGGLFELSRGMKTRHLWVILQGLALLIVVVLALPSPPEDRPAARRRAWGHRGRRVKVSAP